MKEIAKLKAKEEKRKLESEVSSDKLSAPQDSVSDHIINISYSCIQEF